MLALEWDMSEWEAKKNSENLPWMYQVSAYEKQTCVTIARIVT